MQYVHSVQGRIQNLAKAARPAYYVLHPQTKYYNLRFLKLTRPSKTGKKSFLKKTLCLKI